MRPLALALVAAALAGASPARGAPSVSLNGVNIDGVTNQKFEHATVVIDSLGNVDIQVKGYEARTTEGPKPRAQTGAGGGIGAAPGASAPGKLSRRYFVAVESTPPGPQYDLAIFVNAQWIREVKSAEAGAVLEITKYLRPGQNKVTLAATKRIAGQRLAYGKDVALKVVCGEGNVGGDHVMIDVPLFESTRTAAEMDDKTDEFVFDAR
jgi:hypothetical protein